MNRNIRYQFYTYQKISQVFHQFPTCGKSFSHLWENASRPVVFLRTLLIAMVLLMPGWGTRAWGQSATLPNGDGYYYIINMEAANSGHTYDKDKVDNWYLCPIEGDYDYLHWQGNREMPFITTNKEGRLAKYLWRVVRNGDYYYIIHDIDNKYLTANDYPGGDDKNTRRRVHIQEEVTTKASFKLTARGTTSYGTSTYNISSPSYGDDNLLNPAGNNNANYGVNNSRAGLIGFYSDNNGSRWFFEFVQKCVTPEITVDNGNVTITTVTPGATIYYTNDGSDPADPASTRQEYSGTFSLGSATKIKAIAIKADFEDSDEAVYSSTKCQVPTITLDKADGSTTITPNAADEGAHIYYSIDGTTPTTLSTEYTGSFTLPVDATTIKAIAAFAADGSDASDVAEQTLTKLAPPTWSKSAETVTITKPTTESDGTTPLEGPEAVEVYYNLNNNNPTTSSTLYSGAITLTEDLNQTIIKAIAYKSGYVKSDVASLSIDRCATPTVTNHGDGTVTFSCATEGATIRYTTSTNETAPADPNKNSTEAIGTITLPAGTKIIKVRAFKAGYAQSNVFTYTLPKFSMPRITVHEGSITITCKEGGTIYYTTSESGTPSTPYTSPFSLGSATVVRAYATHAGYLDSDIRTWIPATLITSADQVVDLAGNYIINGSFSGSIGTAGSPFTGTLDGQGVVISGLTAPVVAYADGAIIKNVILDDVGISGGTNVGAICNEATGNTRIYNCGVLASSSTVEKDDKGYDKITSYSSTISGSGYVGSIVGLLDGSARVINCFSYAKITGGSDVGGIVGHNNVATNAKSSDTSHFLKTMVMNCMFYGDITGGTNKAPIYNGQIISNRSDASGVSNFNYFSEAASYVEEKHIDTYNCALMAETRYLQRFEFFRHLLNSNRALAAWWATGDADNKDEMMKWVLEPSQIGSTIPYPILKAPYDDENNVIQYASVVNIDAEHAEAISGDAERNQGRKLGTLSVTIQMGSGGAQFGVPGGASITTTSKTLNITDKDPEHFNFNYGKVQLPYYNDVGTGNYTGNRVVTGWKIVSITGGNPGSYSTGADATANDEGVITAAPYNFADRHCTNKDLYGTGGSNRIFNQGAYWDVPEGVTAITIEPYWAQAYYCADDHLDKVYNQDMTGAGSYVNDVGGGKLFNNGDSWDINGSQQRVYTSIGNAVGQMTIQGGVYDNAIVLVGNVHSNGISNNSVNRPYTIMSIDLDKDNEPDYSYILRYDNRVRVHPVRVDFLNIIGLGMAQKSTGGTGTYNFGILQPLGWFESTNTSLFRFTQFEYDKLDRVNSPMILHGGVIEQWVTVGGAEDYNKEGKTVSYYHVGGNVWFKEFHIGVHQDKNTYDAGKNPNPDQFISPHPPISVTGGDFNEFYLTGLYNTPNNNSDDNAECYINGGRFGKVAGTGMQGIGSLTNHTNGNIIWQIDNADIDEFYAGGINAAHIAEGNITTVISNSRVDQFCGGPKFGDMNSDKKVVTIATNSTFRAFFGAGYGGNSYNRRYPSNKNNVVGNINWNNWVNEQYTQKYDDAYKGVETRIDYQFLPMSNNTQNVARLIVEHVSFSLATTYNVTSKLTGCTITRSELGNLDLFEECIGNFYGGGSLGKVEGPVSSTLTNCTVEGNVFGAGYSATLPPVDVMNTGGFQTEPFYDGALGVFFEPVFPATVPYTWKHSDVTVNSTANAIDTEHHYLYTNVDLSKNNLGSVSGAVTLTITTSGESGTSTIGTNGVSTTGHVYGGGDESAVNNTTTPTDAKTTVTIQGNTTVYGDVYGGGNRGVVSGSTKVNIK